jgi:hypothetical protein
MNFTHREETSPMQVETHRRLDCNTNVKKSHEELNR